MSIVIKGYSVIKTASRATALLLCLLAICSLPLLAQENEDYDDAEDACGEVAGKKAVKLHEMGMNRKKYGKMQRMQYLKEAIELEPEYAAPIYELAVMHFRSAQFKGISYNTAERYFQQLVSICPDYHSDPWYYLASISLGKQDYSKAVEYYRKFLKFSSEDDNKFARDYEKKYTEAKADLKYALFFHTQYANPVPYNPVTVKEVSTEGAGEYLPLITPDNEYMYLTRRTQQKLKVIDSPFQTDKIITIERFTMSKRIDENKFEIGMPLEEPFNMEEFYNYGGATVSLDNKHIFLTICKPGKYSYTNCDIYTSDYIYGYNERTYEEEWHWTTLMNLGPNVNGDDSWESQPSLSADGNTLYFATAREDSRGIDIYKTERDSSGGWGQAVNLGAPINSAQNDKTPFIHSDSRTLYFASETDDPDGRLGFGGYDVFYSKMDSNGNWMQPVNIGHPINTAENEHGFVVSTDGKMVYFASDKLKKGKTGFDIYAFELYNKARPDKVLFLKGEIKDEQGMVIPNAVIELKNMKTKTVTRIKVDSIDGKYALVVPLRENIPMVMTIRAEEKVFNSRMFSVKDTVEETFQSMDVEMKEAKVGKPYVLNDIHYASNSAKLTEDSKFVLDEFISYLKENPSIRVEIRGHTDNVGSAEDNLPLSSDRAFSVMDYLQQEGIEKFRLKFRGFGESKPLATNDTAQGRARNRRTEFMILGK